MSYLLTKLLSYKILNVEASLSDGYKRYTSSHYDRNIYFHFFQSILFLSASFFLHQPFLFILLFYAVLCFLFQVTIMVNRDVYR